MSWTAPRTYVTGEILTAAIFNTDHRDNLLDLDRRATVANAIVATSQTTTSTSFTDLATAGPAVTVTVGGAGKALVGLSASVANTVSGADSVMGFAISGATTQAAQNDRTLAYPAESASGNTFQATFIMMQDGLSAGSTTFTAKYRVTGGTGSWVDRRILVSPLGS